MERTFAIIKPHAVKAGFSGDIVRLIELNGFSIVRMQKKHLTTQEAQEFYSVHKEKPFFGELVENISAGPAIVMCLEKNNAIQQWRDLMGATNPEQAQVGSLRAMFGENISFNAVHGSDAPETAQTELNFFFSDLF